MVVSSGKKAVFNQAMLYNIRKPVTVLKDEQMMTIWQVHDGANVSATRSYVKFVFKHKRGKNEGWSVSSVAIMISPLASLMINQVSSLHERGVTAAIVSGSD